ncbi:MAG: carbon-nitrogen hydrolase family protein [Bryobacteraceae bacterium]|nr:carbon-nitrogen hydrolase family protein [Bryobacteraceae bacterium]
MQRAAILFAALSTLLAGAAPPGWQPVAFREEIRPNFRHEPAGGRNNAESLIIETDARDGLDGAWKRSFPVQGGSWYKFSVWRKTSGTDYPQQCSAITVYWQDDNGKSVLDDRKLVENYLTKHTPAAPPEYPVDTATGPDGWTEVTGLWQAPGGSKAASIEMHGRWAANARFSFSAPAFVKAEPPAPRIVRLATVHHRPLTGKTAAEKREQFAPLVAEAARRKSDLVVLGETLTYAWAGKTPAEAAEPIPGPTTDYFAALSKQHNLYIVAGIFEKDTYKVYNTAVLLTPEGTIGGKYRKVTLPDSEAASGVVPGTDFPVFKTRFGIVGMMICYDGFFPEVARELSKNGAEIIAWPVWGCNPELAKARAAENHVYMVSSTYEDTSSNWMLSAVWDQTGKTIGLAKDWGSVAVAEVDLSETTRWRVLGDFRSKLEYHVPMAPAAPLWNQKAPKVVPWQNPSKGSVIP